MNYVNSKTFSNEQQEEILKRYTDGEGLCNIKRAFNVSQTPIRKIILANGGMRTRKDGTDLAKRNGIFKNAASKGEKHHKWRGGKTLDNGYRVVINPFHDPLQKGGWDKAYYIREHRFIWIKENGPIPKGYEIHHINGIKDDNRIENLAMISKKKHALAHMGYGGSEHNKLCSDRNREKVYILQQRIVGLEKENATLKNELAVLKCGDAV